MLGATLDKTSISTELNQTETIKVTLTGSGGFTGDVALTGAVVDPSNAPLTGWTVTFDKPTVAFTADGEQVATATVMIPSQNMGLAATVNITAASSLGSIPLASAVTVANQVSFVVSENGGQCVYPAGINNNAPTSVRVGTKVRFLNMTTQTIIIHSNGGNDGINHEDNAGMPPNGSYVQTLSSTTDAKFSWYCHAPGPDMGNANPFIAALP
jgi:hypothetical protein